MTKDHIPRASKRVEQPVEPELEMERNLSLYKEAAEFFLGNVAQDRGERRAFQQASLRLWGHD